MSDVSICDIWFFGYKGKNRIDYCQRKLEWWVSVMEKMRLVKKHKVPITDSLVDLG